MSTIWSLPKVTITGLNTVQEKRPAALITSDNEWSQVGHLLKLPLVVQAEPANTSDDLVDYLADNLPSQVEVIYAVGNGVPVTIGKIVAHRNKLPLVVVPLALDTDGLFEHFVERLDENGLWKREDAVPASEIIIDWEVIAAAPKYLRGAAIVDLLSIVTALLDWRHATLQNRARDDQKFSSWGTRVAAQIAEQAMRTASDIGEGRPEGLRTLVDLLMLSVQLANQLGHDRHQEGTEHYFAFSLRNQGADASHAELVAPGILVAAKLHNQDTEKLREAIEASGIRLDQVRIGDAQLAMNDLPNFATINNFPYGIAHQLDTLSTQVQDAMRVAGFMSQVDGAEWEPTFVSTTDDDSVEETAENSSTQPSDTAVGGTTDTPDMS